MQEADAATAACYQVTSGTVFGKAGMYGLQSGWNVAAFDDFAYQAA